MNLLHNLEGRSGTQYDLSFQSGLALSAHGSALGARQAEQSAMIVSVEGDAASAQFSVLVDDTPSRPGQGRPVAVIVCPRISPLPGAARPGRGRGRRL